MSLLSFCGTCEGEEGGRGGTEGGREGDLIKLKRRTRRQHSNKVALKRKWRDREYDRVAVQAERYIKLVGKREGCELGYGESKGKGFVGETSTSANKQTKVSDRACMTYYQGKRRLRGAYDDISNREKEGRGKGTNAIYKESLT